MIRLLSTIVMICWGVSCAIAQDLPKTILNIKPGIVGVGTYQPARKPEVKLKGTGFAILNGTYILTNYHVIDGPLNKTYREELSVFYGIGFNPQVIAVEVIKTDRKYDLALLKMKSDKAITPLKLHAPNEAMEGLNIAFTGYPIGAVLGLYPVTHRGIISAISPVAIKTETGQNLSPHVIKALEDPYYIFQLDAIAYPGNSGSPVYIQETGEVVGILNSVYIKSSRENLLSDPSGISYAVPVKYIQEFLEGVR